MLTNSLSDLECAFFSAFHLSSPRNVLRQHNACKDLHADHLMMKYKQCAAENWQTAAIYAHSGNLRKISGKV